MEGSCASHPVPPSGKEAAVAKRRNIASLMRVDITDIIVDNKFLYNVTNFSKFILALCILALIMHFTTFHSIPLFGFLLACFMLGNYYTTKTTKMRYYIANFLEVIFGLQ